MEIARWRGWDVNTPKVPFCVRHWCEWYISQEFLLLLHPPPPFYLSPTSPNSPTLSSICIYFASFLIFAILGVSVYVCKVA